MGRGPAPPTEGESSQGGGRVGERGRHVGGLFIYLSRGRCKVAVASDLLQAPLSSVVRLFAKTLKMYIYGRELNKEVGVGFDVKVYRCAFQGESRRACKTAALHSDRMTACICDGERRDFAGQTLNNQRVRRGLQGRKQRDGVSASVWPLLLRTSLGELVVDGRTVIPWS